MDLIEHHHVKNAAKYSAPPCVARYRPIFWEPVPGTGERVVALISLEPHESSLVAVSSATYCVLQPERLRQMFGRQRGAASIGILDEVANFLSAHQRAGLPLNELTPPFHGFHVAPAMVGRGYDVDQLLDAAVRSVSAFGNPELLIEEESASETPRSTLRTAQFLKTLKRYVAGDDAAIKARFDKKLKPSKNLPDLTIDYAHMRWAVQVTSLPATPKQSNNALRESQSKLLEIQILRDEMAGNEVQPVLLINEDVLAHGPGPSARAHAESMSERLRQLSASLGVEIMTAATPEDAASLVKSLA